MDEGPLRFVEALSQPLLRSILETEPISPRRFRAGLSTELADLKPPASIRGDYRALWAGLGLLALLLAGAALLWWRQRRYASRLAAAQVPEDFPACYGGRVVLLETFVQTPRFRGTCYRAANWQYLGETTGRGKCARSRKASLPPKAVYVYPLAADFRAALGVRP